MPEPTATPELRRMSGWMIALVYGRRVGDVAWTDHAIERYLRRARRFDYIACLRRARRTTYREARKLVEVEFIDRTRWMVDDETALVLCIRAATSTTSDVAEIVATVLKKRKKYR